MLKNKKAIMLEFLVRVVLVVAVFLLIVFPACDKLSDIFYGEKDIELFEEFVENINKLGQGQKAVFLRLNDKNQAVVGFSRGSSKFQYVYAPFLPLKGGKTATIISIFEKPTLSECSNSACICLCSTGLEEDNNVPHILSCENLECRKLENIDIIDNNLIFINPYRAFETRRDEIQYWKGGFLFGRSINTVYNGLPEENKERTLKVIEKRKIGDKLLLGVCSQQTYEDIAGDKKTLEEGGQRQTAEKKKNYRLDYFGSRCIVTEFEEGKQFEKLAGQTDTSFSKLFEKEDAYKEAITKYEEFIEKYEKGYEVEDAMYRIGLIYKEKLNDEEKAKKVFEDFLEKYPGSEIAGDVIGELSESEEGPIEI